MGKKFDKFLLLMWKNWLLQYRKPIQTAVEILAPVLFSIILVVIRSLVDPTDHDAVVYRSFCPVPVDIPGICSTGYQDQNATSMVMSSIMNTVFTNYSLIYSPNTSPVLNRTMSNFHLAFGNVIGVKDSEALEQYFVVNSDNLTFAGIQFDDSYAGLNELPTNTKVSLRFPGNLRTSSNAIASLNNWLTNLVFPVFQISGPRSPSSVTGASPSYYREGFLAIQHLLSLFMIFEQKDITVPSSINDTAGWLVILQDLLKLELPSIGMRRFSYAAWEEDILLTPLKSFVGMIFMLSFVYTCINTVKSITAEKEKQLKEAMKIMGLPNWLHWTAWFLKTFSFLFISIILMVILLKVKWYQNTDFTVFTHANPFVILLFLFFYVCATITFSFAISVFFSKANTAATMAGLAWFLSYAPYLFLQESYDSLGLSSKLFASLGSNSAMAFGFQLIVMFEGTGDGVQWDNLFKPNTPDDNLSLGLIMVILFVDTIIYLLVALYVEAVFPGEFGVPQPWYFPFTYSFWCGQPRYVGVEDFSNVDTNPTEFFEKEPQNQNAGIKIRNIRKVFGNKAAVRNLSLNMYEGQITVLLGHNGAGKTTTMSMLTGMFPPTSGTAIVGGYDIRTDIDGVRNSLGLCPQHNIIFDDMTVEEHLYFFSRLKGLKRKDEINSEIEKYVNLLELQDKKKAKSKTLSGGMKRKLCVGVALCGNSKIVMLDEPTAGMDPSARRALWDLLLKQKEGRTLLLTTHFMDEADLLGDRIAIMAGGELQCCGSSFFLKKKYGAGYHLVMDKSVNCDPMKVTALLRKHIPNIEIHNNIGSELMYLLAEDQLHVFETMLKDLEEHSEELGINSYGISLTTLEEVFMKVGADHGQEELYNNELNGNLTNGYMDDKNTKVDLDSNIDSKANVNLSAQYMSAFELVKNQFYAMTLKKVLSILRSWVLLLIQITMPVLFLILAIIVMRNQNRNGDLPAMPMTLEKFSNPVTLVERNESIWNYADVYENILKKSSMGTVEEVANITDEMFSLTASVPTRVRRQYIVGATFSSADLSIPLLPAASEITVPNITAWFNNDPYHSPGISLSLALNSMYKKVMSCDECSIEYTNHPLPYDASTQVNQLATGNNMGFQLAFNMGFSMAFVSSFYILFVVRERVCKSKHLQFVSGVNPLVFWCCSWLWDMMTYLVTVIAVLITLVCFQEDGFKTPNDIGRLFLILFYFGWAMLPLQYLAGYCFAVPSTGFTRMTLFSIFTGVAAFLIVQVLSTPGLDLEYVGHALHWLFLIIPHYSLASGVSESYNVFAYNNMCERFYEMCRLTNASATNEDCLNLAPQMKQYCEGLDTNYYKWESPGIGRNLLYSFLSGAILFALLLIIEYKVFSQISYKIRQKYRVEKPVPVANEDEDVAAEKEKIRNMSQRELFENYILSLKDLTKYYDKNLAVNSLCLGVKKYECFGLLGINGAGKTTTFKMMTGDEKISYGDGWVNSFSIKNQMKEVQKQIGYCPQFDALLDDLTARESLVMFSLLRAIRYEDCNLVAESLAKDFDFTRHLDKKVKELSGGNKRKLSTSLALIGNPPVIYLDEPTTGMDPATKRYLWNALCRLRDNGKCVVLTSHTMEECEALCTRLAIMVNGNFKCLGSTQHLKNKFAEGYTLTIKIKKNIPSPEHRIEGVLALPAETAPIEQFIDENFPGAILREKHHELLTYYITDKSKPWSRMFGILEAGKKADLNIEDYCLGQSSLEQVFLLFTRLQR